MKTLSTYVTEGSDKIAKLQERANSINTKIVKLQETIEKHQKRFDKILDDYKKHTEFHNILPYDILANFQPSDDRSWDNIKYNRPAYDMLVSAKQTESTDVIYMVSNIMWDYFNKAAEIYDAIERKKREIIDNEIKLKDVADRMNKESDVEQTVSTLFEQVPEIATFIEECAKRQYTFMIDQNEKVKKAWEVYYKVNKEACEYHNDVRNRGDANWYVKQKEMFNQANKIKPKMIVRTEEQIRKDVEMWKTNERRFLADRITTEFGKVISCSLHMGDDMNVNGVIVGSLKEANIETIWAGGYNIQRLHTRFLVHEK